MVESTSTTSRAAPGPRTQRPCPPQDLADDGLELADVAEGEGPQERAQRRGRHHPERQHRLGAAAAQHVGVIDVGAPGHDGVHQAQHLAARPRAAHPARQADRPVHQRLQPESDSERAHQQQAGVRHQVLVVEAHLYAVDGVRYSAH